MFRTQTYSEMHKSTPLRKAMPPPQTPSSDESTDSTSSSNGEISLIAQFDDIVRYFRRLIQSQSDSENTLAEFSEQCMILYKNYFEALDECKRLQSVLDEKIQENSDIEHMLTKARRLLDQEKQLVRKLIRERDDFASQLHQVRDLLFTDKGAVNRLSEEMRYKLSQLSAIKEINSTGSILSDFSYSRSEDDLDGSCLQAGKAWKKHRPSTGGDVAAEPATKKRRSSLNKIVEIGTTDTVRATTTLTVSKEGPITATSVIESVPKPSAPPACAAYSSPISSNLGTPRDKKLQLRQHTLNQKIIVTPTTCVGCDKRIGFGRTAWKCKQCNGVCHVECKGLLKLPCIPSMNTPTQRNGSGFISDYTPTTPPMVPSLLIHCINEIELRGLGEIGLYRIPGAERDVKSLKEKFLKGKTAPCLNTIDVHVICGVVKDFLRSLREPIVTYGLRQKFVQAVQSNKPADVFQGLYQAISELPQPNRDTLAYMILHLQKISQSKECKMNCSNLAKCFGPSIVGYTSDDPNPNYLLEEIAQHNMVMERLLDIPSDYWSSFVNVEITKPESRLQQTPSTDSLLRPGTSQRLFRTPK